MVKQSPDKRIIEIKPVSDPNVTVHPRSVSGLFNNWRLAFVWLTQIVFYGLCWLPWNGRQAVIYSGRARRRGSAKTKGGPLLTAGVWP